MKGVVFSLTLALGIGSASAQFFVVDGMKYTILDETKNTCAISGFSTSVMTPDVEIPEFVTYKDIEYAVTEIGYNAFCNTPVESVKIPSSIISIGINSFNGTRLKTVTIPKTVLNIGSNSFGNCPHLEYIRVEEDNINYSSVDGVLYNKTKDIIVQYPGARKEVVVPDDVYLIYDGAFDGCSSIASIELPESITEIGREAFSGCSSLILINIPAGVKEIGMHTFKGCVSLESVNLPSEIEVIDRYAFLNCSSLASIKLPENLKYIGESAFNSCSSLTSVVFPENLRYIEKFAFYRCGSLNTVTCLSDKFIGIEEGAFSDIDKDAKLYVVPNLIEEYKNSDWGNYFAEILPLEPSTGVEEIKIDNLMPFDVYNLSGALVKKNASKENLTELTPDIYIIRQGNASQKIRVR